MKRIEDLSPTDAPPGSREKIEVMARRAAARVDLFHPRDAADWANGTVTEFLLTMHGRDASTLRPRGKARGYVDDDERERDD